MHVVEIYIDSWFAYLHITPADEILLRVSYLFSFVPLQDDDVMILADGDDVAKLHGLQRSRSKAHSRLSMPVLLMPVRRRRERARAPAPSRCAAFPLT